MSTQSQIFEIEVQMSESEEFSPQRWTFGIDNLNALSMYELLRALDKLKPRKRAEVMEAAEFVLVRTRRWTGPFDRIAWAMKIVTDQRVAPTPYGLFVTREGFSEPTEVTDAKVFIAEKTKGQGGQKSDFIALSQPSMALNAAGLSPRYHMKTTRSVADGQSIESLIGDVAGQGRLKHLIFNSHGRVAKGGETTLELGAGLSSSNTGEFTKLSGKVGVIWICGCLAANSELGKADCIARAKNSGAYLVAPAFLMMAGGGDLAPGRMDMNVHYLPHVFTPGGDDLPFSSFIKMGTSLGFTTHFAS